MKNSEQISKLTKSIQNKIFTDGFFRLVDRVVKFEGETIYFVHDRFTIQNLGVKYGRKWIQVHNSNACSPFYSFILGLKTDLPVKTWWKDTEYEMNFGTEESPSIHNSTYYADSNKPLVIRYVFGQGDDLKKEIEKEMAKADWQNLLHKSYNGWWFDNPEWIDRFAALGILTDCLEVFKNWKTMKRD